MSLDLDPKVVLQHLHELGYRNIAPQQLDEFIRDLEKLIRYEVTKKKTAVGSRQSDDSSSTLPNTTDESRSPPSPVPPPPQHKHHAHHIPSSSHSKQSRDASSSSSESSIRPSRKIFRECTKMASHHRSRERDQLSRNLQVTEPYRPPLKSAKSCECLWRKIGCKGCDENWSKEQQSMKSARSKENVAPPRPKSSFIRTWQMTGQPRPGSASQRSDPVALYHQYQQLWKQQKLPGENSHNDLRWTIRERMLGQEPHPRSCCCDCKCCPCKLKDTDFSKDPKKVSSKILPRGPFHLDGRIYGPLGVGKDGDFVVRDGRLTGVFELGNLDFDTGQSPTKESPEKSRNKFSDKQEVGAWLSKDEVEKANHMFEKVSRSVQQTKKQDNILRTTPERLRNCKDTHDKSTCQYCGLIHYALNSNKKNKQYQPNSPDNSPHSPNNSQKSNISYWPQQFTNQTDFHRKRDRNAQNFQNTEISKVRRQPPSSVSKPLSPKSERNVEHSLNLAVPATAGKQNEEKPSPVNNYFETTIPIRLKGFKGDVKTEIEVSRLGKSQKQTLDSSSTSEPLVTVATKPLSQASSRTSMSSRQKRR